MTVLQLLAVQDPHASTVLRLSSASVLVEKQVCSATSMMRASVIHVERALSVIPTPSVACLTATVHLVMLATPAIPIETSAALVPTHVSMVASVSTLMVPSPVTVFEATLDHAVNKTSTNALQAPARMTELVWIASATTPAFACLDLKAHTVKFR